MANKSAKVIVKQAKKDTSKPTDVKRIDLYMGKKQMEFDVYDYYPHQRSYIWLVVMSLVSLLLVAFAILTGAYMMAVAIVVFVAVYWYIHGGLTAHTITTFGIYEHGVLYEKKFLIFDDMEGFYHLKTSEFSSLNFTFKDKETLYIYLMGTEDIAKAKEILRRHLPEKQAQPESVTHYLMRKIQL